MEKRVGTVVLWGVRLGFSKEREREEEVEVW